VSIDLRNEKTLNLTAAARMLPPGRRGRPVSLSCVLRWVLDGVRLRSGDIVRLEAVRLGGRWITSVEALERFADRLTPRLSDASVSAPPTPGQRRRAAAAAEQELDQLGL
jgi:hypothetical protein